MGGFLTTEIRNITANLMSDVCPDVGMELTLQPVTDEQFQLRTTNREDDALLDVVAQSQSYRRNEMEYTNSV